MFRVSEAARGTRDVLCSRQDSHRPAGETPKPPLANVREVAQPIDEQGPARNAHHSNSAANIFQAQQVQAMEQGPLDLLERGGFQSVFLQVDDTNIHAIVHRNRPIKQLSKTKEVRMPAALKIPGIMLRLHFRAQIFSFAAEHLIHTHNPAAQ